LLLSIQVCFYQVKDGETWENQRLSQGDQKKKKTHHAVQYGHAIANGGCLADDHPGCMIDHDPGPDGQCRVYVHAKWR
jgi:hypothetical protein